MRLIKKLSLLLALSAPLAIGCGNNQQPQQSAPVVLAPAQPLLPSQPVVPSIPPPPSSAPGAPVIVLVQNWSARSTGDTIILTGTNLDETPIVTFTCPGEAQPIPAAFVARDQNNPAQLLVGTPNLQAMGRPIGLCALHVTNPSTGQTATGPNLTVRVYAPSFSFGMSNAPNASLANHLGSGMDADPITIRSGDLNNDGTQDFAVANQDDQSVSVLFRGGNVNPNYSVQNLPAGHVTHPRSLVLADFNQDGKLDFVVADRDTTTGTRIVSQSAGGGWSSSVDVSMVRVSNENALGVGDFNMDGKPDVAAVGTGTANNFNVYYGTGDLSGTLTHQGHTTYLSDAYALQVGNFDADRTRPDIMLVNDTKARVVSTQSNPNALTATFQGGDSVSLSGSSSTRRVTSADINDDGWTDLAVTTPTHEIECVVSNASNGIWTKRDCISTCPDAPKAIAMADFNGDGILDMASITGYKELTIYPGKPSAWSTVPSSVGADTNLDPLHNRNAEFDESKKQSFTVCDGAQSLLVCDVNGDGMSDLAIACKKDDIVQILTNVSS